MKYRFSFFTLLFSFCLSSLYAQVNDMTQSVDSTAFQIQDRAAVQKISFYTGNVEFIDKLRQDNAGDGNVKILQDYRIDELLRMDRAENLESPGFQGYRIQVFSGGGRDREKAFSIREDLELRFPDQRVYVKYQAPDFRVRIGNFRNKFEAMYLYKQCVEIYPYCYLVKDQINLVDFEAKEIKEPEESEEIE